MDDRIGSVEDRQEQYPHTFKAPYTGIPTDVNATFVWVPYKAEGYALFMFADEAARDDYAARFEEAESPTELPRRKRRTKHAA